MAMSVLDDVLGFEREEPPPRPVLPHKTKSICGEEQKAVHLEPSKLSKTCVLALYR